MASIVESDLGIWTAADLVEHFGAIRLNRLRGDPIPGTATEADLLRINEGHEGLCELIDGTLVEKAMGNGNQTLDGGDVLPGFSLPLRSLFVQT